MFFQAGGAALVLWGRDKLAEDAGVDAENPEALGGIALAHNVRSRAGVDRVLADAKAGGKITPGARKTFYGDWKSGELLTGTAT